MAFPLALAGCAGELSTLAPAGPAAEQVADLWWAMLAGAFLILAGVMAAALYALKRKRGGEGLSERAMLIGGGLIFPTVTLAVLMGWAFLRGELLLARPDPAVPTADVEAGQWFWEFSYPGGERTLNELHVPAGREFQVRVQSPDVIHSFWVPRLGGKIDAIPGKVNRIALRGDRPGIYFGTCAEYCGVGHATMQFVVYAHEEADYAAALAAAAGRTANPIDVVQPRRMPATSVIRAWADYLLEWVGLR